MAPRMPRLPRGLPANSDDNQSAGTQLTQRSLRSVEILGNSLATQPHRAQSILAAVATCLLMVACGGGGSDGGSSSTANGGGSAPGGSGSTPGGNLASAYPLMFVTSVPGTGFTHQLNTFGNHGADIENAVPGGDLYIRYPDGTLRNLTKEAGFGAASGDIQGGANAIAVREPTVHWSGTKAVFSMMLGGPTARFQDPARNWQMYEVTGLGKGEQVVITKVANQPAGYNNTSPIYGSDDKILFTSDAPLYGMTHTYPQLDEYENAKTMSGIWKLDPASGTLKMIEHAPSGAFNLYLDSFGRVVFTKWDHLKRDQQADSDRYDGTSYGPYDVPDESPSAVPTRFPQRDGNGKLIADPNGVLYDAYPEALVAQDPTRNPNEALTDFNQFFIWQVNEDGSAEETMNHVGRHEFGGEYMNGVFLDDPNLTYLFPDFDANASLRSTFGSDSGIFQLKEDPSHPGRYLGVHAQEFGRQASGRVVEFTMPPGTNPETVAITDYTNVHLDDDPNGDNPRTPAETGHYRNPVRLTDGSIVVSHTPEYRLNQDDSTDPIHPKPRYVFQIKSMVSNPNSSDMIAGDSLTGGIVKDIRWWTDDATPHEYNGPLNETDLVEVRPRPRPTGLTMQTASIEKKVIADEGVDETALRQWLANNQLALIVSRNVTLRDRADVSQPFNLSIPGGTSNIPKSGKVYDIDRLQILQGDLTRGYATKPSGRRVYVKPMHDSAQQPNVESLNPSVTGAPQGTVKLGADGSMAAFVPAGRALTWQLLSPTNQSVVRERVWVSFAPGEIRTCANCHGLNSQTQNGLTEPLNEPQALHDLLKSWKQLQPAAVAGGSQALDVSYLKRLGGMLGITAGR